MDIDFPKPWEHKYSKIACHMKMAPIGSVPVGNRACVPDASRPSLPSAVPLWSGLSVGSYWSSEPPRNPADGE